MPNRFDVYLHDTPLKNLFSSDNRRRSHGCVRVQNPRELASLLLQRPMETIEQRIALGHTNSLSLPAPVPVFFVYQTAFIDQNGALEFRPDVYQRDEEVWAAPAPGNAGAGRRARAGGPTPRLNAVSSVDQLKGEKARDTRLCILNFALAGLFEARANAMASLGEFGGTAIAIVFRADPASGHGRCRGRDGRCVSSRRSRRSPSHRARCRFTIPIPANGSVPSTGRTAITSARRCATSTGCCATTIRMRCGR